MCDIVIVNNDIIITLVDNRIRCTKRGAHKTGSTITIDNTHWYSPSLTRTNKELDSIIYPSIFGVVKPYFISKVISKNILKQTSKGTELTINTSLKPGILTIKSHVLRSSDLGEILKFELKNYKLIVSEILCLFKQPTARLNFIS